MHRRVQCSCGTPGVGVVTARVTTLQGAEAGAYYVDHLPRYYLNAGEPPGRWHGRGAVLSGLVGDVDPEAFTNVLAGFDPSGAVVRGYRSGEKSARGFDVTCSAPKSLSVLWAIAPPEVRERVEAAHEAAVAAVIELVDHQAVTRRTTAGVVSVVDCRGVAAAVFRQHTSRAGDPQLHSHVVVSAKVQALDGRWLALDARSLKFDQRTLSALYHTGLRAELTASLGLRWNAPVDGIAELATIDPEVRRLFSRRTEQYQERLRTKLDRFRARMEREPTPRERWKLEREAAADSRPAKAKSAREPEHLHVAWRRQLVDAGTQPRALLRSTIGAGRPRAVGPHERSTMVEGALAALTEERSTWRRNDLLRELARALPPEATVAASRLPAWLGDLAEATIAHRLVELAPVPPPGTPTRSDGRPVTESTLDRRFTTEGIIEQEQAIDASAARRVAAGGGPGNVQPGSLNRAQLDVARAVAGTAQLTLVVGPAGAGKTTALRPAVEALRSRGRKVIGLAPSATAAAVLKEETGLDAADTVDAWLGWMRHVRPERGGTTVIVDEASMLSTDKLARVLDTADRHGCRVALVGDPMQLSAVGRGGMFARLVQTLPSVELEQVHRFGHSWERRASLALRAGDPVALAAYEEHGRIHAVDRNDVERQVLDRWIELRRRGSVAVLAPTNEPARRLNRRMQQHRLDAAELHGTGRQLPNGELLFVGDDVATRHNDRSLRTDRGEMIRNRARWTVEALGPDGAVTITGRDGRVTLPAAYVSDHVELAYAETIHAAQGRTVDHGLLVVDGGAIDGAGLYVGLTRGRMSNDAYVLIDDGALAVEVLNEALHRSWADRPATDIRAELDSLAGQLDQGSASPSIDR